MASTSSSGSKPPVGMGVGYFTTASEYVWEDRREGEVDTHTYIRYLCLSKKLKCNGCSFKHVLLQHVYTYRHFLITQWIYTYTYSAYVQETPTDRANVSTFGHIGRTNCLCILPKTICLHKAMLLANLLSRRCDLCTRSVFVLAAVVFSL